MTSLWLADWIVIVLVLCLIVLNKREKAREREQTRFDLERNRYGSKHA